METEVLPQEEEKKEKSDLYHNPETLWRIAGWARVISWITLALVLISVGYNIYQFVQSIIAQKPPFTQLIYPGASVLYNLGIGVFFFLVLQAVAEGIYILLDIEENTRPKAEQ
jgi:hypothetical protein